MTLFQAAVVGCADNLAHIAMRYMLSVCVEKNEQGKVELGEINSCRKQDLKKYVYIFLHMYCDVRGDI